MSVGNTYTLKLKDEDVAGVVAQIVAAIEQKALWLGLNGDGRDARLIVPAITGFYSKEWPNVTYEKALAAQTELAETAIKQMKDSDSSESWKHD
jgi:hypothetical protein